MSDHNTEPLGEHDLQRLAVIMADDPKFAAKLADAIAERLDEKFGWRQGDMRADIAELNGQFKALDQKFDRMEGGIDTLARNIQVFAERQETLARNSEKRIEKKLDERFTSLEAHLVNVIDRHLGVPR